MNRLFAALPTTNLSVGTYVFIATYSGSNNFLGSTSSPFTEQINPASTDPPSGVLWQWL